MHTLDFTVSTITDAQVQDFCAKYDVKHAGKEEVAAQIVKDNLQSQLPEGEAVTRIVGSQQQKDGSFWVRLRVNKVAATK